MNSNSNNPELDQFGNTLSSGPETKETVTEDPVIDSTRVDTRQQIHESYFSPQQKEIYDKLKKTTDAQARVEQFAKYADDYGLEALLSLIPHIGDAGAIAICGAYMLYEARNAGLSAPSFVKIIAMQGADFLMGNIWVVGDVGDFLFKANKWSKYEFYKHTEKLIKEARAAGIPEAEIKKLQQSAEESAKGIFRKVFKRRG